MTQKQICVGIVGANAPKSWANVSHVPAINGLSGLRLAAVATRNEQSARKAAEAFGADRWFADPLAMIGDDQIDVITISVNVPAHRKLVLAALSAGKAVYCEAPLGRTVAEAQRLARTGSWAWQVPGRDALHLSNEWYRIYGFDPKEVMPAWEEWLQRLHPEDREKLQTTIEQAIRERSDHDVEFRIVLPDGTLRWIHTVGHPRLSTAGELVEFAGSSMDITERKQTEQRLQAHEMELRQILDHTPLFAAVFGPSRERLYANRIALDYLGLRFDEWRQGRAGAQIHPEDLKRYKAAVDRASLSGSAYELELRMRKGDGNYRWFLARYNPVRDDKGQVRRWYVASTDIEDRKQAEQLQADFTHASRVSTLGEMVASISHELAQPITITTAHAKASLRWLQHDPPNVTEALKGTEKIIEAGALASEVINRLRSLYKKSSPKRELVSINEVVGEMAGMMGGEAREHGVSIRTDLKNDLPMTVADRVQLQQVLMNLMLNGIQVIKDTGGVLMVKSQLGEDGQIQISVHDTGPGLPTGKADQIFDAFFTTKPQGSGMGLAISKSIVESHGGRIWANGDGGRGATFHFTLPAAPAKTNPPVDAA
jgi:PAS domain S-box-containing protein